MNRTQLSPYGCSRFNSGGKMLPVRFPTGAKIIKNRTLLVTKTLRPDPKNPKNVPNPTFAIWLLSI